MQFQPLNDIIYEKSKVFKGQNKSVNDSLRLNGVSLTSVTKNMFYKMTKINTN